MKLTQEQLLEHFNDRLRMLQRSCDAYDGGDYAEAARIASTIIKLIGDRLTKNGMVHKQFVSLTTRIGIKPAQMVDSSLSEALTNPELLGPVCTLGFHLAGANGLIPILDRFERPDLEPEKKLPFEEWWTATVVRDAVGNEFSRKVIVETMRDQEDAHTDDELDSEYGAVAYEGAIGIQQIGVTAFEADMNPARVVVRQVAHEVLRTFLPEMAPKFLNSHGFQVQPVMLFQVAEVDASGQRIPVLDRKAIHIRMEGTISSDVWRVWDEFAKMPASPAQMIDVAKPSKNFEIRMALIHYAPYDPQLRAMVGMQHPIA